MIHVKSSKMMAGMLAVLFIIGLVAALMPMGVFAAGSPGVKAAPGCQGFGQGGGPGYGPGPRMMHNFAYMWDSVAKFLGMDAAALRSERETGKSIEQIAKEKGKSEKEVTSYIVSQHKARLDQLVKEGTLTPEQASAREEFLKDRIKNQIKREGYGPGMGGCGRWGSDTSKKGPGQGSRGPAQQ